VTRAGSRAGAWGGLVAGLAVTLTGGVAVWAAAGLETPLMIALVAWGVATATRLGADESGRRAIAAASLPFALLALTRPDGPIFAVATAVGLALAQPRGWRTSARFLALPVVAIVAQESLRLAYYHDWVPNTARIKIAFTPERVAHGLDYLRLAIPHAAPLLLVLVVAATAALRNRTTRARAVIVLVPMAAWTAYVAAVGGDFFPGYRLLIPLIPAAACLIALGAEVLRATRHFRAGIAAGIVLLLGYGALQLRDPEITRAASERWIWDKRAIGVQLGQAFAAEQPRIAVIHAGWLPYWSNLPALDMLGLNDAEMWRHASPEFGKGWAGHELGDAGSVLARRPDMIEFSGIRHTERTGYFRVERDLARAPDFQSRYRLVTFVASGPESRQMLWVDRESARIGVTRSTERVRVPGLLFADNPERIVTLDGEGKWAVKVPPPKQALLLGLDLPPGHWEASTIADAPVIVGMRHAGEQDFVDATQGFEITDGHVDLVLVAASEATAHVREVVLSRR